MRIWPAGTRAIPQSSEGGPWVNYVFAVDRGGVRLITAGRSGVIAFRQNQSFLDVRP
jgi:hypothetical protein